MNYIVNIIGIGEAGKIALDNLNEKDYEIISKQANQTTVINGGKIKVEKNTQTIRKVYYDESTIINSNENTWFNFIVYDNKDKDIASRIAGKIENVEFLNIGICINGNDDIPKIKVLKTNIEDASDVILNMLQPILNLLSMVGYDVYDIQEFLNTNSKYEIIHFNDIDQKDNVIKAFDKYSNMSIEVMPILSTITHWSLAKQSDFLKKIWNLKCVDTSDAKWHLYFVDYINKDMLTIIVKLK